MDTSKILFFLGIFLLITCLVLCSAVLSIMHRTVTEVRTAQNQNTMLTQALNGCITKLTEQLQQEPAIEVSVAEKPSEETGYILRECNGTVAVYTLDGYLVKLTEVRVDTLPSNARDALRTGIRVNSWQELLKLVQDYGG